MSKTDPSHRAASRLHTGPAPIPGRRAQGPRGRCAQQPRCPGLCAGGPGRMDRGGVPAPGRPAARVGLVALPGPRWPGAGSGPGTPRPRGRRRRSGGRAARGAGGRPAAAAAWGRRPGLGPRPGRGGQDPGVPAPLPSLRLSPGPANAGGRGRGGGAGRAEQVQPMSWESVCSSRGLKGSHKRPPPGRRNKQSCQALPRKAKDRDG